MTRLTIENGTIALPAGVARELAATDLALASWSGRHLLLGGGEVLLAGRIGEMAVADLLSFLNMFRKSGLLHLALPGGTKDLHFVDGEIVHAVSTVPEEDLGEFLLASGAIDREMLVKVRQRGGRDSATLRRLLLEGGHVSPKEIWAALLAQVEAIVYNLIPAQRGDFVFYKGDAGREESPGFLLSTQNLIMEGLRRCDERLLFQRHIPSLDAIPVATGVAVEGLAPSEARILALAESGRSPVRDVIARSGLSEFDGLRLLHGLVERKAIRVAAPPGVAAPRETVELVAIMNGALAELFRRITPRNHGFGLEIRRFLRDLPQPFSHVFRHVALAEDGTVDSARIVANLSGLDAEEGRRLLVEAMDELLFMACHAARRDLGEADSDALVQRVREIGRRARQLTERKTG